MIKNANKPRIFLVTGSSSGIGKAVADTLYSDGINVVYHGKSEHALTIPPKCEYIHGDLSVESVVDDLYGYISNKYSIQGVVCCAGRTHLSNLEDVPNLIKVDDFNKILNNIFICTLLTCQKFSQCLISQKKGKIIIVGGDVVDKPNEKSEMCGYAIAKAAVHQYALYLANFLRPHNISVNVVAPTGVFRRNEPFNNKTLFRKSFKEEVANVISFLCKDENFISGQTIRINGGRSNYFKL